MRGISDDSLIQISDFDLDFSVRAGHWTFVGRNLSMPVIKARARLVENA